MVTERMGARKLSPAVLRESERNMVSIIVRKSPYNYAHQTNPHVRVYKRGVRGIKVALPGTLLG